MQRRTFLLFWTLCLTGILLLSIFGRKIQKVIVLGDDNYYLPIITFVLLCSSWLFLFFQREKTTFSTVIYICSFLLLIIGGVAIYTGVLVPIEAVHFLIFSVFGYFSSVFGLAKGFIAVIFLSTGDEILQYFLPYRVGDLHDVFINLLSGTVGLLLAKK